MTFTETPLRGSYIVELQPFRDERGWFARYYCKDEFKQIGHNKEWMQLNHSVTYEKGAIRGMHYQNAPFKEIKLVRCIAGAIFDAVIDLRRDSATFLKWFGIELSAENKKMSRNVLQSFQEKSAKRAKTITTITINLFFIFMPTNPVCQFKTKPGLES